MQKKVAIPGLVVGAALGAGLAGRSMVRRWAHNSDPLDGEPPWFPEGLVRTVDTPDGARLHTVTAGGDGPTVVFVHGLTASKREWGPMARGLIDLDHRVIAIDQRGHGESTTGHGRFGSAALAEDLATVFERLDLHASLLVGQSMGGMAAMAFATDHPEVFSTRVSRLALVATTASMAAPRSQAALRFGAIPIPDAFDPADERLRVATALAAFGAHPSLNMIDSAIAMVRACPEHVRVAATAALLDHDVRDRLDRIAVPTIVIGGTRDQMVRPHQVRALADGIPGARLEMLEGAGHMLIWERHERVAELVLALLAAPAS